MIYLKIRGRLGNQLFQYAAAKTLQEKYYKKEELCIDFSDLKKLGNIEDGFCDSLVEFKVDNYTTVNKVNINFFQRLLVFFMKIPNPLLRIFGLENKADIITYKFEKFMQPFLNYFGVYYMIHGFTDLKPSKFKNKVIYGNFECSKYFDDISESIKKMFIPKKEKIKENESLYDIIKNNESVCITIRRGDFITNEKFKKIHFLCNDEYFYKGLEVIKNKVKNPVFIIFSDDIEWVKANMDFGDKVYYETGNDPVWEKLRLMSSCKHFVISNSTFSWWAQYLSKNQSKIVVSPKIWKNHTYKNNPGDIDIYQDNWIKI